MAELTPRQVDAVARLARLALEPEERERLLQQLNDILNAFGRLRELDTEGVEPTSHVVPLQNVMREDRVRPSLPREEVLRNAPRAERGYFQVPRIVEEG